MVYRDLSAFLTFFLRRVLHFKKSLICQILAKIIKIYSDIGDRLINRSSYTCRYMVFDSEQC